MTEVQIIDKKTNFDRKISFFKRKFPTLILLFISLSVFAVKIPKEIAFEKKTFSTKSGKQVAYVARISPDQDISLRVALADFQIFKRLPLSKLAKKYNAIAAINGAFFSWNGQPLGTIIINHKIVSLPVYKRSVFCITDNSKWFITTPEIDPYFIYKKKKYKIDGINQKKFEDSLIIYTPEFGRRTNTDSIGLEIAMIKDRVIELSTRNSYIPPDGYVISIHDDDLLDEFSDMRFMDKVEFQISLEEKMKDVRYAIGGGPRLVKDSEIDVRDVQEKFKPNLVIQKAPRTGIGIDKNGNIIMAVVDGRQKGYSIGLSLKEFARFMHSLGCIDAMNLDGGGSTTMVIDDSLINRPSDGQERELNGAIIIEKRAD